MNQILQTHDVVITRLVSAHRRNHEDTKTQGKTQRKTLFVKSFVSSCLCGCDGIRRTGPGRSTWVPGTGAPFPKRSAGVPGTRTATHQ